MFSLRRISVSIICFILVRCSYGGIPLRSFCGAADRGTGLSCVASPGFWSSFSNQALLASNKSFSAGINYENRYGIPELGTRSAGLIVRTGSSSEGLMLSYFGYSGFRRIEAGISCGMLISENSSAGIQIDYFSEKSSGETYHWQSVTFEAGAIFRLTEKTRAGFHLFNPVPNSMRKSDLPSGISAGAGVDLSSSLFAAAEVEKWSKRKMAIRFGFDYEAAKRFRIRGGFSSESSSFSLGLGYSLKSVTLDMGFSTHERLGVTSSVSLVYKILK